MKVNPWLLPAAAFLVTGAWIVSEKRSAATLEREITVLTERIHQAGGGEHDDSTTGRAAEKSSKDKDTQIDWKDIGGKMARARVNGGPGDIRTYMRLQQLLLDMSGGGS